MDQRMKIVCIAYIIWFAAMMLLATAITAPEIPADRRNRMAIITGLNLIAAIYLATML